MLALLGLATSMASWPEGEVMRLMKISTLGVELIRLAQDVIGDGKLADSCR